MLSCLQIKYLGHMIDAQGLLPTYGKIKVIKNAPQPKNVMELHLFPSIPNYYSCFKPILSKNGTPKQLTAQEDKMVLL